MLAEKGYPFSAENSFFSQKKRMTKTQKIWSPGHVEDEPGQNEKDEEAGEMRLPCQKALNHHTRLDRSDLLARDAKNLLYD